MVCMTCNKYINASGQIKEEERNNFVWLFVGFRLARFITYVDVTFFCLTVYSTRLNLGQDRKNLLFLLLLYLCQCFYYVFLLSSLTLRLYQVSTFIQFFSLFSFCCLLKFNTIYFASLLQSDYYKFYNTKIVKMQPFKRSWKYSVHYVSMRFLVFWIFCAPCSFWCEILFTFSKFYSIFNF